MKRALGLAVAAVAMFMFTTQSTEAQHFHRGFAGPGFGGNGFSISVGRNFGPAFGPGLHFQSFNRGFHPGFVNPGFYRPLPVQSFYRGGIHSGFHGNVYRRGGFYARPGFRPGCGW